MPIWPAPEAQREDLLLDPSWAGWWPRSAPLRTGPRQDPAHLHFHLVPVGMFHLI